MWFWRAPVLKRIGSARKWLNHSFIASAMRGSLAFTWHLRCHTPKKNFDHQTGLFLLVHPSRRRVARWQKNHNNCKRDYGGTPLIRPPTGHGNLSVLTGVKARHSLVLHTCALLLHRLTQSDQTEEKTSKLTNKRPPRTDWRPREQLQNYSHLDPLWLIRTYKN